ncbi:rCG52729 [Rattus norvegicus]|uniref:RCG52729 n=1 Tax=Rattus norvegicus TaxID=10116 RepID=A6IRI6_RAT|nr:rCG52729 [Rattus norvegicus]
MAECERGLRDRSDKGIGSKGQEFPWNNLNTSSSGRGGGVML